MTDIIIFDFEVFAHDTLLGAKTLSDGKLYQLWDLNEIKQFYVEHIHDMWIGHNNVGYDSFILEAVVEGKSEEEIKNVSNKIINEGDRFRKLKIDLTQWDLIQQHWVGLKVLEAYIGKNISETQVRFDIDRKLTEQEKLTTESYNRDDLEQTEYDFIQMKGTFQLRLDSMKEWNLPKYCLNVSGTRLAEEVLHAKKTPDIETWTVKPKMYDTLQVKNKEVIDFYMNEDFRKGKNLFVTLCGCEHKLGAGGIHAAQSKYHTDHALYFDVSGYYNLVMINYDLLPRSISKEGKDLYIQMYHDQLEMKKTGDPRRGPYKTILLSVFGAMTNEHCRFYDPEHGTLVTMTGQIFLVDLLEKLEDYVKVVQSNTDGIIVEPFDWSKKDEVLNIVKQWCDRTGFVIKPKEVFDIYQRDVNCYMYRDEAGEIQTLGEAVKDYGKWEYPFWKESYNSKEPIIISTGLVEYYMMGKRPEDVVNEHKNELRMFQYICKRLSYDWLEYENIDLKTNESTITYLQGVNRAFAWNDKSHRGMVYKRKYTGKTTKAKVSNLPESVFVYDNEILSDEAISIVSCQIDYDYYIKRIYERIEEFRSIPQIKELQ